MYHSIYSESVMTTVDNRPPHQWRFQPTLNRTWGVPWIEALRGGEYRQTYGRLYDSGAARCAVGVLCDIAARMDEISISFYPSSAAAVIVGPELINMVVDLNDVGRWDFNMIADYLETLLESEPEPIAEPEVQTFVLGPFLPSPSLEPVPA